MLKITGMLFIAVLTLAAISAMAGIIALAGIWAAKKQLVDIGVAAAVAASWLNVLILAVVAGRQSRRK